MLHDAALYLHVTIKFKVANHRTLQLRDCACLVWTGALVAVYRPKLAVLFSLPMEVRWTGTVASVMQFLIK